MEALGCLLPVPPTAQRRGRVALPRRLLPYRLDGCELDSVCLRRDDRCHRPSCSEGEGQGGPVARVAFILAWGAYFWVQGCGSVLTKAYRLLGSDFQGIIYGASST